MCYLHMDQHFCLRSECSIYLLSEKGYTHATIYMDTHCVLHVDKLISKFSEYATDKILNKLIYHVLNLFLN